MIDFGKAWESNDQGDKDGEFENLCAVLKVDVDEAINAIRPPQVHKRRQGSVDTGEGTSESESETTHTSTPSSSGSDAELEPNTGTLSKGSEAEETANEPLSKVPRLH